MYSVILTTNTSFPTLVQGKSYKSCLTVPTFWTHNRNDYIKEIQDDTLIELYSGVWKNIPEKPESHVRWVPELKRLPVLSYPDQNNNSHNAKILNAHSHTSKQFKQESFTDLVKTIVMNSHVIQERCFLNVLQLGFRCSESELLFVHVWNVTENIVTSSFRNNLEQKDEE